MAMLSRHLLESRGLRQERETRSPQPTHLLVMESHFSGVVNLKKKHTIRRYRDHETHRGADLHNVSTLQVIMREGFLSVTRDQCEFHTQMAQVSLPVNHTQSNIQS